MKRPLIVLFVLFYHPVFSQPGNELKVFNDTSLFFIQQVDSSRQMDLTAAELRDIDEFLIKAINEFNRLQQRHADSANPKKRKNRARAIYIDSKQYYFLLIPLINKENQKEIWLSGQCKDHFIIGKRKVAMPDRNWKSKFIASQFLTDGGSCHIQLLINLTLRSYHPLAVNGDG